MHALLAAAPVTIENNPFYGYGISHGFWFDHFLSGLLWTGWVVLNLWIWQKTKALGNLLMLVGAAVLGFMQFLRAFTWAWGHWLDFLALGALSLGFFLSIRPLVEAQLAALKAKIQSATTSKKEGSAPPPPHTPAS
jgi:hypothetical protein